MKRLVILLISALLLCNAVTALAGSTFDTAADNAMWTIMEINSSGTGFTSDGAYENSNTNTIAVTFLAEKYSYAQFREIKEQDAELYASLTDTFLSLSNELNAVCDFDPFEKIHIVFSIMSNDGVGLFLTVDNVDMTWMLCNY